jgi:hypothetical protein
VSTVTQRRRALSDYLPFLRQRAPAEPVLVDGELELERAYQIMQLLSDLEETSQARILDHVQRICIENAERRHAFLAAASQPTTRPPTDDSRTA